MKTVGITGGTGLVGTYVAGALRDKGYDVLLFSRDVRRQAKVAGCRIVHWNPEEQQCDIDALSKLDAAVHLAGEPVAGKRWTEAQKAKIASSRVDATRFLIAALQRHAPHCKVFIGASATGYYGPDKQPVKAFTEESTAYNDFLGSTCRHWEEATMEAEQVMRTVRLRIGIVLAKEGGAFAEFVKPLSFGVRAVLGDGKQTISWIHVEDLASMIVYALEHENMKGVYNAVAPEPLTNAQLMRVIAKTKGGLFLPVMVPSFVLKVILGEMSVEVLKSCTVSAEKISAAGFKFDYPEVTAAVRNLLEK